MTSIRKTQHIVPATTKDGESVFRISDGSVDRDGDIVQPSAWRLDEYRKNPVVLWAHDYRALPVGKCASIAVRDGQLIAAVQWLPPGIHELADAVARLVKAGYLTSTSVGFKPLQWTPNRDTGGRGFTDVELLEFSIVPVPANPQATVLQRQAAAGYCDRELVMKHLRPTRGLREEPVLWLRDEKDEEPVLWIVDDHPLTKYWRSANPTERWQRQYARERTQRAAWDAVRQWNAAVMQSYRGVSRQVDLGPMFPSDCQRFLIPR